MKAAPQGRRPKAARRGVEARNDLVLRWSGLPAWAVRRWAAHPAVLALGPEDARQAGFLGLLRAAELFDEGRGVEFKTYAVAWIRQAIRRASHDAHPILTPYQRPAASPECVAAAERALACERFGVSRDGTAHGPADRRPGPAEIAERNEETGRAHALLRWLDARSRDLLLRRAGGETLEQVAQALGLTRERVRQIEAAAMTRLRQVGRRDYRE